jgi:tetratricopeptide (TPR) repeat protein
MGGTCGDAAGLLQRFKEAHAVAVASRSDDIAAKTAALIPPYAINRLEQTVVAQEWLMVARGDVARLGHETLADAILAQAEGMLALSERAYERALAAADRSIAVTRRLLGPDDPLTIQWEANKADWQQAAGRLDEALSSNVQARKHLESVLGREHPRIAYLRINEGEVLNLLGRHAEAEAAYRNAATLFRQSGADEDVLAWSLTGLGQALLGQEKAAEAVQPLEEALAIRVSRHVSAAQLGETRFALAKALWSRPTERRRALTLGVSARDDYGKDTKAVAEIDAWLHHARSKRI